MAFDGYLLKVGDYTFPAEYIQKKGYQVKKIVNEANSYKNANGVRKRDVYSHYALNVSVTTLPGLTNTEVSTIMTGIKNNYIESNDRKVNIEAYLPEEDSYIEQEARVLDIDFPVREMTDSKIVYEALNFVFEGY